ncbi:MAG: putative quinol monooxygenase [Syntrophales bacterium]|nr:putative quinol monooxygenase [Syntrophales bacterium]
MVSLIAKLPIKEGKMEEAVDAFKRLMVDVAKEEGTVLYSLNRDNANPNMLIVIEQYKDKAALDFHSATPYFKAFFAGSASFIGGRPEIIRLEEIHRT